MKILLLVPLKRVKMRLIRPSTSFLAVTLLLMAMVCALHVHSLKAAQNSITSIERTAMFVRELELTDLCIFTEASYTRHLTQTDLNTPFQDSPFAFEHFPSGSLVSPPVRLMARGADLKLKRNYVQRN